MKRNIDIIQSLLPPEELLAQLAEELDEFAQAALKLRRTIIKGNPTPATREDAYANLLEECADVSLCMKTLGIDNAIDRLKIDQIMQEKAERWATRLQAGEA